MQAPIYTKNACAPLGKGAWGTEPAATAGAQTPDQARSHRRRAATRAPRIAASALLAAACAAHISNHIRPSHLAPTLSLLPTTWCRSLPAPPLVAGRHLALPNRCLSCCPKPPAPSCHLSCEEAGNDRILIGFHHEEGMFPPG